MEWLEQIGDQLWRAWLYLTTSRVLAIVLGVGFAILAIGLFIASRTKWGRAKPLTKFVVVSVVLHVWLLMYAVGQRAILPQGDPNGTEYGAREHSIAISFEDSGAEEAEQTETRTEWAGDLAASDLPMPDSLAGMNLDSTSSFDVSSELEQMTSETVEELQDLMQQQAFVPSPMPALPPEPEVQVAEPTLEPIVSTDPAPPSAPQTNPQDFLPPPDATARPLQPNVQDVAAQSRPVTPPEQQLPQTNVPREYQLRQAPNRLQLARAYGADADTEASVEAGLKWLAGAQSPDGSWNAAAFGAGTETRALNEHRYGTGAKADTGVSGLALLAFLSAGHTHQVGDYRQTVRNGIAYLMNSQMPSGDMSGPKQIGNEPSVLNSRMYSHGIASLALAEAHAMTQDPAIRRTLLKAAEFTIKAQDPRGGGWRYQPGYPGDLSQFGWQAMALKSVERSGIQIPREVTRRMFYFLDTCSAGRAGGLATYMPKQGRPSDTMTAEALACRLLLDYPLSAEGTREAKSMILKSRPGVGEDNVYFWYYATLALFQLQDDDWKIWNQALKERLLRSQTPAYGVQPGSWDPDRLWGGYGGRVYSTAMSCLCLEVYYRYLPLYQRSNLARVRQLEPIGR